MDLKKIKSLVELLHHSRLTALELSEDGDSLRLERHVPGAAGAAIAQAAADSAGRSAGAEPATPAANIAPAKPPGAAMPVVPFHVVKASMQGILHLTPAPNEAAFVGIGDQVQAGQVICVIEAMKMFNTIETEAAGRVVAILAEAGAEVKQGQPLFHIE
ncbi:acetyl-CoA carboxylase, biotin carboxyl carrier protein [Herbaspirillum sp. CF444]|uniref:acetyl-CoA carboxylase biotin carboxyl carrier protein n=1 Tax=Herbaspirillum sp. CF444 TaxID=1144319 RepID=UPI0002725201|nr:acetyl-CoA carboxylase biotin carboxyl carrier protein [Herbaspirillum sp. CF444]EJL86770.1 acetyl-CoA carboxylase, biotin carboxyl carrier protein [Herbaspirillum sp. CF444]